VNAVTEHYKGNLEWLPKRTILFAKGGSHAYGTNTPASDLDLRGVGVAPKHFYHGFANTWNEATQHEPTDLVIFEVTKYFSLAADCNPNVIEMVWQDPDDYLVLTPQGEKMIANRHLFVSKKAKFTFSGYAIQQLKRINTHYRWLKNPPTKEPSRSDFGLPEMPVIPKDQRDAAMGMIKKQIQFWEVDLAEVDPGLRLNLLDRYENALQEMMAADKETLAGRALGFSDNFLEMLGKERAYRGARQEWDSYQNWKKTRNEKRAELEARFGYDTKHAMHLVRLLRMCEEILTTGKVVVKRPDAAELLEIRNGAWTYEALVEWASTMDQKMAALYETSPLPHSSDRKALDKLCVEIVDSMNE
jgi:predicted nucleotidyltransferase